jgi:phage shock protein A
MIQEARAQSAGELAGHDLESQFAQLESSSGVDDELAALKAQITLPGSEPTSQPRLPEQTDTNQPKQNKSEPVDSELESLRKELDNM